jgi:hypothetical protein
MRLIRHIQARFLQRGLYYSDQDRRVDALASYRQLMDAATYTQPVGQRADFPKVRSVACLATFITDFCERHVFALRRPALHRRHRVTEDVLRSSLNERSQKSDDILLNGGSPLTKPNGKTQLKGC